MTESEQPNEEIRDLKWEKIQAKFNLVRDVMAITPDMDPQEALERIIKQDKGLLRAKKTREELNIRNRNLKDMGLKPTQWHLLTSGYKPLPTEAEDNVSRFTDNDKSFVLQNLPLGFDAVAFPGIRMNSEEEYAKTGERISTTNAWEVFVKISETPTQDPALNSPSPQLQSLSEESSS